MNLNHIDLQVSEVEKSRRFFETFFNLSTTYQRESEIALLEDANGMLLGVSNLFGSPPPTYPPDFHVGFRLDDVEAVKAKYQEIKAAGVPIKYDLAIGGPALYFVCLAPDGIAVEVSAQVAR